jgi:hypothetical protein
VPAIRIANCFYTAVQGCKKNLNQRAPERSQSFRAIRGVNAGGGGNEGEIFLLKFSCLKRAAEFQPLPHRTGTVTANMRSVSSTVIGYADCKIVYTIAMY